jgi:hypothetical protein
MKIALLVFAGVIAIAIIAYYFLFPGKSLIIISRPGGGSVTFSRTSVSLDSAPDHYSTNGFDHIEPYISRFLVPSPGFKSLGISTPDGMHALGLHARDGHAEVFLSVERRSDPGREATIRHFFASLGIRPSQDYLASNGGVPDSTRCLTYPISGSVPEVTTLTKRVLSELCGVSSVEALDFDYREK